MDGTRQLQTNRDNAGCSLAGQGFVEVPRSRNIYIGDRICRVYFGHVDDLAYGKELVARERGRRGKGLERRGIIYG